MLSVTTNSLILYKVGKPNNYPTPIVLVICADFVKTAIAYSLRLPTPDNDVYPLRVIQAP